MQKELVAVGILVLIIFGALNIITFYFVGAPMIWLASSILAIIGLLLTVYGLLKQSQMK